MALLTPAGRGRLAFWRVSWRVSWRVFWRASWRVSWRAGGAVLAAMIISMAAPASAQEAAGEAPVAERDEPAPGAPDPKAAERAAFGDFLFELLRVAETREAADQAEADIWAFWFDGPDPDATRRLAEARRLLAARAFGAAEDRLGELIADFPDWAEPYNQRAILYFLLEAYDASLADIDRTLRREPRHFGALSGSAQIYIAQSRFERAAAALRQAQEIHPWIRGSAPPGIVEGQDL